LQAWVK